MEKTINGYYYDTENDKLVGQYEESDIDHIEYSLVALYRNAEDKYYLYGEGGPFMVYHKSGAIGLGQKLHPISDEYAQRWAKAFLTEDEHYHEFVIGLGVSRAQRDKYCELERRYKNEFGEQWLKTFGAAFDNAIESCDSFEEIQESPDYAPADKLGTLELLASEDVDWLLDQLAKAFE